MFSERVSEIKSGGNYYYKSMRQIYWALLVSLVACDNKSQEQMKTEPPSESVKEVVADSMQVAVNMVPQALSLTEIPKDLRPPGQLLEGWRWTDSNGENLLVVFRTVSLSKQEQETKANPALRPDSTEIVEMTDYERSARLTAKQYVRQQGKYKELWRVQDAVTDCAFDMTLGLRPGSTAITDLDRDGRSETTIMYASACRSDVSAATLKLIMRAGEAKYALRGSTVVQYDSVPADQRLPTTPCCLDNKSKQWRESSNTEGYYQNETDFRAAPAAFLQFARKHWQKFSIENMEDHEDL